MARRHVLGELRALRLEPALADDVVLMVSELATNVVQHATRSQDGQMRPPAGAELWMYRRIASSQHELLVAVFDQSPERPYRVDSGAVGLDSEGGRGLMLVDAMARGRWGAYPTRSRLANRLGKVTWFAVPMPHVRLNEPEPWERDTVEAGKVLRTLLSRRGFGSILLRACPESGLAVLSVATGLTVWCQAGHFRWRGPGGQRRAPIGDVSAVAEEIVHLHVTAARPGHHPA
ncbi:anti-sigma regulatory factor (Ser/Thr protein kinase) [Actinomadura cellulosilytica]|uniref:Anti-sigma regulatory factor (Ser/Thr protein kinase) n=1 Tax=Thermomonospora cellulosilytica TaxID=1411118 RepID=A0A7W3MVV5_9ACTN|nr:ATP-binding protein [Thermomonospora cellulosilytica]MBA9002847.1 anti-sigma regulatory factor (Ser/Thr protein kinase) [Thermomonospora cellulosilytica]